ncbi:formiminoglutamase [Psychromonas ingrahamii 37]|uniref:Formimidoylglutamase n=1 Tax=Psychromonas ingrahamii (strain DSM 17664 / CCUG 51855 / 37) TaxID=357804 RepID=A1STQ5_PSYIN|nr:formimidoylglutamase [Psychromonas ingrahamii]ABM02870.1 formiminoglutamase [Psychromonas ingrahamii 37]
MTDAVNHHLYQPTAAAIWQGRTDIEDGSSGKRFHHMVSLTASEQDSSGITLLGFCCDEGVRRNKGRIGAFHGPDLIRQALANSAWHHQTDSGASFYDGGNVFCHQKNLEESQKALAKKVTNALNQDHKVIVLGGGHEIAWGSFQGLAAHLQEAPINSPKIGPKIGIINFDAHFDLRTYTKDSPQFPSSSGTPFRQIADFCTAQGWAFNYACLGVSRASNTQALFSCADSLKVFYREDNELASHLMQKRITELTDFIAQVDYLYLTIDIDVFSAAIAPGVSAPAARGLSYETVERLLQPIFEATNNKGKKKLLLADLAEYNPEFDIDKQTAKLAARLAWDISHAMFKTL